MTLPRLAALKKGWDLVPPVADTVHAIAVFLGAIKSSSERKSGSMEQLMAELGGISGMTVERKRADGDH